MWGSAQLTTAEPSLRFSRAASTPTADSHATLESGDPRSIPFGPPLNGGSNGLAGNPGAAHVGSGSDVSSPESAMVKELNMKLLAAQHERDDLLKDVEALCMQASAP